MNRRGPFDISWKAPMVPIILQNFAQYKSFGSTVEDLERDLPYSYYYYFLCIVITSQKLFLNIFLHLIVFKLRYIKILFKNNLKIIIIRHPKGFLFFIKK